MEQSHPLPSPSRPGSVFEVFIAFLKLGLTSFGGPIAHIGYFNDELIERRQWLDKHQFAQLLAICQFLPGPASSQLGFTLGLLRAGWLGAAAAFVAFTLPSAVLLVTLAGFSYALDSELGSAFVHGLKIVAVVVVTHGVWGMMQKLSTGRIRSTITALAAVAVLLAGSAWLQVVVIFLGALAGYLLCRDAPVVNRANLAVPYGVRTATVSLILFFILLIALPLLAQGHAALAILDVFYRAGALVFGGGHVVLPLLEEAVVETAWVSEDSFLAGYGAAQAVPGPMFSFAAFLGAELSGPVTGLAGAGIALIAIFLPGFLLIIGLLPFWYRLASIAQVNYAIAGVNAAVVGLLLAALYDPVFTSGVLSVVDLVIAIAGFCLLAVWRVAALYVVAFCVLASLTMTLV